MIAGQSDCTYHTAVLPILTALHHRIIADILLHGQLLQKVSSILDVQDRLIRHGRASEVILDRSECEGEKTVKSAKTPTMSLRGRIDSSPVQLGDDVVDGHDTLIDSTDALDELLDDLDLAVYCIS